MLIAELGLTHTMAARVLGITDRQVRRYVSGEHRVPQPTGMLLEFAVEIGLDLDRIGMIYHRNNSGKDF